MGIPQIHGEWLAWSAGGGAGVWEILKNAGIDPAPDGRACLVKFCVPGRGDRGVRLFTAGLLGAPRPTCWP